MRLTTLLVLTFSLGLLAGIGCSEANKDCADAASVSADASLDASVDAGLDAGDAAVDAGDAGSDADAGE